MSSLPGFLPDHEAHGDFKPNALNVWRLADAFTLPALEKAAVEAALRGFEELPPQLATGAEVVALVQEDRLVAKSEEAVFLWIKRWWEAGSRPEAELLAVMKHVRFAVMAAGFLRETVFAWPALRFIEAQSMLLHAVAPTADGTNVVPRWGVGPGLIYVVGGKCDGGTISSIELYDPQAASWTQLASMTSPRAFHSCATLHGELYVAGGVGGAREAFDTAEVYDPQTDGWQPLAKMTTARCALGLAAAGGKIYAIGGSAGERVDSLALASVEAFDPQLGSWTLVASMSVQRKHPIAVVLDGLDDKFYVIGGLGHADGTLDIVEVYDAQADSWQQLASMPQRLCYHSAAAMGGKIYVTGGFNQAFTVDSVCVYDPQTDTWTQLASMSTARRAHASAAVGGKLYVFGGRTSGGTMLDTVEVYDPASNSWVQETRMTSMRGKLAAAALAQRSADG